MEDEPTEDWKAEVPRCQTPESPQSPEPGVGDVCRFFSWMKHLDDIGCLHIPLSEKEKDGVLAAK